MKSEGEFRKFSTGAVRDTATKKPMIHLISPFFLQDLGEHLRFACRDRKPKPYPMRNWEKGMSFSETLGSGLRHLIAIMAGDRSEDHTAAIGFCAMCIAHYRHEIAAGRMDPALDDLPHYPDQPQVWPGIVDQFTETVKKAEKRAEAEAAALIDPKEIWHKVTDTDAYTYDPNCYCERCCLQRETKDKTNPDEAPTFYITGPMRGIPQFNFPLFDEVAERAREAGCSIISPAELDREHGIDPMVDPDSTTRAWEADPNLLQTIAQRDCEVILGLKKDRGDGLILLPDWDKSVGARAETALALWLGLTFRDSRYLDPLDPDAVKRSLFCQEEL